MLTNASFVALVVALFLLVSTINTLPEDEGCIRIKQCPAALKHVQVVRTNKESLNILRRAHCGFAGMEPVVKCNSIPDMTDSGTTRDCIPLQDCPKALKLMQTNVFDPQVVNMFRTIHCGMVKLQPMVYCGRINM